MDNDTKLLEKVLSKLTQYEKDHLQHNHLMYIINEARADEQAKNDEKKTKEYHRGLIEGEAFGKEQKQKEIVEMLENEKTELLKYRDTLDKFRGNFRYSSSRINVVDKLIQKIKET